MTMYIYGQQINWFLQFWITGINGDNVATCPYLARDTCIQRGMLEKKQDPYILDTKNWIYFSFCRYILYITISVLLPAFHCKLESRKHYQVEASHGTQHVVLYVSLDCVCVCLYIYIHGLLPQIWWISLHMPT